MIFWLYISDSLFYQQFPIDRQPSPPWHRHTAERAPQYHRGSSSQTAPWPAHNLEPERDHIELEEWEDPKEDNVLCLYYIFICVPSRWRNSKHAEPNLGIPKMRIGIQGSHKCEIPCKNCTLYQAHMYQWDWYHLDLVTTRPHVISQKVTVIVIKSNHELFKRC